MNIQRKNSAHHFRMQSEREQTLVNGFSVTTIIILIIINSFIGLYGVITTSLIPLDTILP